MTLLELQRRTFDAVRTPLNANYGMKARANGKSMHKEAADFIRPNDRLTSFERLEIYNRQYWFRLLGAMSEDFPAVEALLGESAFEKFSVAYLSAHPSQSFTLRNLGQHLETWLRTAAFPLSVDPALVLDTARLEWAHIEAFDNLELPALTLKEVGALSEGSSLGLQPHVRLLSLDHPVDNFVIAIHHAQDEPSMASNAVTQRSRRSQRKQHLAQLQPEKLFLAVHRHDEFVYYKRLDPDAFHILTAIDGGASLADALGSAAEASETDEQTLAENIQSWFAVWGELGWFIERQALTPEP